MKKLTKSNYKKVFVNFFGSLGYLICAVQWLWVVLLYFSVVQTIIEFVAPADNSAKVDITPLVPVAHTEPTVFMILLAVVTIIIVIALSVYLIYKVPTTVVKTSKTAVQNTASFIAPIVIKNQHKKESKKLKIQLTTSIILVIKFIIVFVPVILAYVYKYFDDQILNPKYALISSAVLALFGFGFFTIQYMFAWFLKVKNQELW